MQEFTLDAFVNRVRERMYNLFPFLAGRGYNNNGTPKHGRFNEEIRDVAFRDNPTYIDHDRLFFDIGNENAERNYPYYHILQDAPVIRKRGKGTDETRGSQAKVKNLGLRDYGRVSFNGKTYSKEYAKNVRGKRASVIERATRFEYDSRGNKIKINPNSLSYKNEHYQYINKILETSIREVAPEFGYRLDSVRGTSLKDDYQEQTNMDGVIQDMIESFIDRGGSEDE